MKRIFISNLPETATENEIRNAFKDYGFVESIEIKERRELGPKNTSLFFAYINIEIDDINLQQCFQDFANTEWHGQYVQLQIARESFLERLKREREQSEKKSGESEQIEKVVTTNGNFKKEKLPTLKPNSASSSSDSDSSDEEDKNVAKKSTVQQETKAESVVEVDPDLVIKNNRGKMHDRLNGLKIASVGNAPILTIDKSKPKPVATKVQNEANLKRLESLNKMKSGYRKQKLAIKSALSNVDNVRKPDKEVTLEKSTEQQQKRALFEDDDGGEDDFEGNFQVGEHFQGKAGQKLLQLQTSYKNDKRFSLDQRFLEENGMDVEVNEENNYEAEKQKEYEILEQVLGKKVAKFETNSQQKTMTRYDPSQPEHSKYEVKPDESRKKRKLKVDDELCLDKRKDEEVAQPEVSKEVFYKVAADLKDTFQEKQEFSLLNMFGKAPEEEAKQPEVAAVKLNGIKAGDKNPFKYDSSDGEEEIVEKGAKNQTNRVGLGEAKKSWSEPFFFKEDDFRLQEGFDFMERMKFEKKTEFQTVRRELKEIVRSKVKNNQRKNRPFQNKLGGNRRKKMIRLKKALKR